MFYLSDCVPLPAVRIFRGEDMEELPQCARIATVAHATYPLWSGCRQAVFTASRLSIGTIVWIKDRHQPGFLVFVIGNRETIFALSEKMFKSIILALNILFTSIGATRDQRVVTVVAVLLIVTSVSTRGQRAIRVVVLAVVVQVTTFF